MTRTKGLMAGENWMSALARCKRVDKVPARLSRAA